MTRIHPDRRRLCLLAFACWLCGSWLLIQGIQIGQGAPLVVFLLACVISSSILLALGIAFWQLGTDQRAGVQFDTKGMMLNMGHYAAFVGWDNISAMGLSQHRSSLLAIGSLRQLGLQLHDPERFVQSYEERLPASRGPLALALRSLWRLLRPVRSPSDAALLKQLQDNHARTGYHLLIPEALLGQHPDDFLRAVGR